MEKQLIDPAGPCGLDPSEARDWIEVHEQVAWKPQQATEALRRGLSPRQLHERFEELLPCPAKGRMATGEEQLDRLVARHGGLGVSVLPLGAIGYPARLDALVDAPPILLVRGNPHVLAAPGLAIVGSRAATRLGSQTARRLGRELAESGFSIVSGLARGIDAEAHRGALDASGRTIAVLACGPDRIYPPEHRRLADEILERGAIVTEMPLGTPPRAAHFPLRNRLISGLALGIIVVEARRRSGSLITVRHALNQGREVFVVPGSVEGPFSEGTNQLLREGARIIRHAADVLEDLGVRLASDPGRSGPGEPTPAGPLAIGGVPAESSRRILAALEAGPAGRDELSRRSGLEPGALAHALLELELSGRVVEERDGRIHRHRP